MNTPNLTDEGTHEFDFTFVYGGVTFDVTGSTHNTITELETCEQGFGIPSTNDDTTEIELLSAITGEDGQIVVTDELLLKEIENELYNY